MNLLSSSLNLWIKNPAGFACLERILPQRIVMDQQQLIARLQVKQAQTHEMTAENREERRRPFLEMDLETLGQEVLTHGQHKGKTYKEVVDHTPSYPAWILSHQANNLKFLGLMVYAERVIQSEIHDEVPLNPIKPKAKSKPYLQESSPALGKNSKDTASTGGMPIDPSTENLVEKVSNMEVSLQQLTQTFMSEMRLMSQAVQQTQLHNQQLQESLMLTQARLVQMEEQASDQAFTMVPPGTKHA